MLLSYPQIPHIIIHISYIYIYQMFNIMDNRTKRKFLVFIRRFRKNYQYFLGTYSGKNAKLFLDQFVSDNAKMAQYLFGDEGERIIRSYGKRILAP
jgi:hypothetical protein